VDDLPARQRECLEAALALAERCRREDPEETAARVREALDGIALMPEGVENAEADSAAGALLQREASPRGMADAFYLVGSLAGLELKYPSFPAPYQPKEGERQTGLLLPPGLWMRVDDTWAFLPLDLSEGTEA
jgi:hypothetical protein